MVVPVLQVLNVWKWTIEMKVSSMAALLLFIMLTACTATPQDLSGKMFTFPQETNTASVKLDISTQNLNAATVCLRDQNARFFGLEYKLSVWHSVCSTWDAESGLGQLWFDGKPSVRKFISGSPISQPIVVLGQEQDSYGGGFDIKQSFVGMTSDVHMWDYVRSPCEIQRYVDNLNFSPGNVLNWMALTFDITGRVLIEDKIKTC
ncbi:C-reactive protein-like [Anableps anableps]